MAEPADFLQHRNAVFLPLSVPSPATWGAPGRAATPEIPPEKRSGAGQTVDSQCKPSGFWLSFLT